MPHPVSALRRWSSGTRAAFDQWIARVTSPDYVAERRPRWFVRLACDRSPDERDHT